MVILSGQSRQSGFKPAVPQDLSPEAEVSESLHVQRDASVAQGSRDAGYGRSRNLALDHDARVNARPRTANGVGSERIKAHISFVADDETYRFPTPVKQSFAFLSPAAAAVSTPSVRSVTPDTIGLAIGSPSQAPPDIHSFPSPALLAASSSEIISPNSSVLLATSPETAAEESRETQTGKADMYDVPRPKLSRWRSLGGLFGRRKSSPARQQTTHYFSASPLSPPAPPLPAKDWPNWSGTTISSSNAVASPGYWGAEDAPKRIERAATLPIIRTHESPLPSPMSQPLLDVEIPNVHFERYSVMFNGILPHQRMSMHSSSLLARRQASSERPNSLKPLDINTGLETKRYSRRRATSPEPTASPSMRLMLFPPESSRGHQVKRKSSVINRPRPLRRTRTAPGVLSPYLSGGSATPNPLSPMYESEELLSAHSHAMTPTPSTPSQPATPGEFRPNTAGSDTKRATWKYTLIEDQPSWEMLTVRSRSDSNDYDAVRLHGDLPVSHAQEEDWHQTAEVSIARSMSVSRPRMQLLRPVRVENERFGDKRAFTPLIVDVCDRNSVAVQIESA